MNKQEENIVNILTFDEIENIVEVFKDTLYNTDKTVALITNKYFIEYAMDELLQDEDICVKKIDLEINNSEYMLSIDDDGNMVIKPIIVYNDKDFEEIEYAFVDMDGSVSQMTIDTLLNSDVTIELFGYSDEDENDKYVVEGKSVTKEEFDKYVSKFKKTDEKPATTSSVTIYKVNNKEVSKEEFDKKYEEFEEKYMDNIRDILLSYCEFMDEVNDWKSSFLRW